MKKLYRIRYKEGNTITITETMSEESAEEIVFRMRREGIEAEYYEDEQEEMK